MKKNKNSFIPFYKVEKLHYNRRQQYVKAMVLMARHCK
nr:MAG TPA: hypothetical protein [Caudoviricetes sp.]